MAPEDLSGGAKLSPDQADLESLRDSLAQLEGRLAEESERARAAERRLAVQQALLDNRLLQVENNRIFTAWRSVASRLLQWRSRFAERNPRFHELRLYVPIMPFG